MKGSGNRQHHGALGAAGRGLLHGAFHRLGMAGNDRLLGRIQIGGRDHLAVAALRQISATWPGRSPRIAAMAPSPAGTASCMYLPARRTRRTASANDSAPAATSAEYSPRLCPATKSGRTPFSSRTPIGGHGNGQNRRLGVLGELQRLFRAGEAQSRRWENPSARSASSNTDASCRKGFRQFPAHAGILRALPGKQKCKSAHVGFRDSLHDWRLRLPRRPAARKAPARFFR